MLVSDSGDKIKLIASWNGCKYDVEVELEDTIANVKRKLSDVTNVDPKKQKLIGLVRGKLPSDEATILDLKISPGHSFMMMGRPDEEAQKELTLLKDVKDIVDDFDIDYSLSSGKDDMQHLHDPENKQKLEEYASKTEIRFIHPLREGKKLLVLDLDYTLFDCKSSANSISELMRPGMHEFLIAVYEHYDLVIWSQTSWSALEAKVTELGILTHDEYRRNGKERRHQVKSLDIIWRKLPQFGPHNTVHVDDVSRNFAMNPQSGLKIAAFKEKNMQDRELLFLAQYLLSIVDEEDFSQLNHGKWKKKIKRE